MLFKLKQAFLDSSAFGYGDGCSVSDTHLTLIPLLKERDFSSLLLGKKGRGMR
jgi:hypothetical protein